MKVLVINAGSSSLKYQLIDMDTESVLAKGNCERIGMEKGIFSHKTFDGREIKTTPEMKNHTDAFRLVTEALMDRENGVITKLSEISAIGHRVAQGGAIFNKSLLVNEDVIKGIESLIPLAPLHNGPELDGIRACREVFGLRSLSAWYLILLSTPLCPGRRICMPFPMNTTKNTISGDMVFTAPLTGM